MHFGPFHENPTFIILLVISIVFKLFPPKKINFWYGYRTSRSKLNQRTWDTAQKLSSKLMLVTSIVMVILQICAYYFLPANYPVQFILLLLWGIAIALLLYQVETRLKRLTEKR